jgi:hypothetical protein
LLLCLLLCLLLVHCCSFLLLLFAATGHTPMHTHPPSRNSPLPIAMQLRILAVVVSTLAITPQRIIPPML